MSRSPEITVLSLVKIMRSTNWGPRCFSTQRYCEVGTGSVGQDGPLNSGPVGVREGLQLVLKGVQPPLPFGERTRVLHVLSSLPSRVFLIYLLPASLSFSAPHLPPPATSFSVSIHLSTCLRSFFSFSGTRWTFSEVLGGAVERYQWASGAPSCPTWPSLASALGEGGTLAPPP